MVALPVFELSFDVHIPLMSMRYRPWRLLMLIISIPGILGVISMVFLHESPKFLLSSGRTEDALVGLTKIYNYNFVGKNDYSVSMLFFLVLEVFLAFVLIDQ